jgi:hypothetical protein
MPQLFANDLFGMVFEHLRGCFHSEDFASGFPQWFQLCSHITQGHIPHQIAHILGTAHFLTMTKPLGGVQPIAMEETLY